MTIKLNVNRTFAKTIALSIDNDGELIEGEITARYKMPSLSQHQADIDATREISVLFAKLNGEKDNDKAEALLAEINAILEEKKGLLQRVLHSIEGLDYVDDEGKVLSPAAIVESALDDIEVSRVLMQAYTDGIEGKMKPKKAISEPSPDTDTKATLEA